VKGRDPCAAEIAGVQRRSDGGKATHHTIERNREAKPAAEQRLKITLTARSERVGGSFE
jgi:hypothetical protein